MPGRFWRFLRNKRATSAIEFALLLPLMFLLMAGTSEYARYSRYSRRLTQVAQAAVQLHAAQSGPIDYINLTWGTGYAAYGYIFPDYQADSSGNIYQLQFRLSSIVMTPTVNGCTASCTYTASLAFSAPRWMYPLNRVCGTLTANDGTPTATTLPSRMFTAASVLVVDASYTYVPLFGSQFFPSTRMLRQAYATPLNTTNYLSALNSYGGEVTVCSGFGNGA